MCGPYLLRICDDVVLRRVGMINEYDFGELFGDK